jgi:hypothetical protein
MSVFRELAPERSASPKPPLSTNHEHNYVEPQADLLREISGASSRDTALRDLEFGRPLSGKT